MKTSTALLIALPILSLTLPASAHHGHTAEPGEKAYLVSWIGVLPVSNAAVSPASCPDFFKRAFISKYATPGSSALQ